VNRDEMVETFAAFPGRFATAARVAEARVFPNGEWGPSEVGRHLIAVERKVWWTRFASIVEEDEPHWSWMEPGLEPRMENATLEEVLARHAEVRARSISILDGFDEAAWARTGVHATFGRLDAAGLLGIVTDHDAEHLAGLASGD
jgi:hypothetical protein